MAGFQVHARVLDLLGEEQIANCPTAISELFKNAYDAYASEVNLDVYPDADQVVLWDDGLGMREADLLERWLAVATPDKTRSDYLPPPPGLRRRPLMGEKGIGRLAISTLGDTLLLVSKKAGGQGTTPDPYAVLFLNWNVVRNRHLLLSEIEVPVLTCATLDELDCGIVADLVAEFRRSLLEPARARCWADEHSQPLLARILDQLDRFRPDLSGLRRTRLEQRASGTAFLVGHLAASFTDYLQPPARGEEEENSPHTELIQLLSNFANRFTPLGEQEALLPDEIAPEPEQPFRADLRVWLPELGRLRSLFEDEIAIGPDDLKAYDHRFEIRFDEQGRYRGRMEIYREPIDLPPLEAQPSRSSQCGPFELYAWYFQGVREDSTLTEEQFVALNEKLKRFGGLMIYRDGLRVLPYGRTDLDWLTFEQRRSKSASRYFFSYRRMFGYVSISRAGNRKLQDKAGREGLKQNPAYYHLRDTLIDFFKDVALRYFHKESTFEQRQQELNQQRARDLALAAEQEQIDQVRTKLRQELRRKLKSAKQAPARLDALLRSRLEELAALGTPGEAELAQALEQFEQELSGLEGELRFTRPRKLSVGRDAELQQLLFDHQEAWGQLSVATTQLRQQFAATLRETYPDPANRVQRRRLLTKARQQGHGRVGAAVRRLVAEVRAEQDALKAAAQTEQDRLVGLVDAALLRETLTGTVEEALESPVGELPVVLGAVEEAARQAVEGLDTLRERLVERLRAAAGPGPEQLELARSEALERLQEQVRSNLELVQIGLAVEIIDHDLTRTYRSVRDGLQRLQQLWRNSERSLALLGSLAAAFAHLEQRYRLMKPLYRGASRQPSLLDGARIRDYLLEFLGHDLAAQQIALEASPGFVAFRLEEVAGLVLPVFVNLVDNALFWLAGQTGRRRILLDREGDVLLICDSGPGIHPTLLERIFEPFFSTKPNGRGLGLHIARSNLELSGHRIWATNDLPFRKLPGACFCVGFHPDVIRRSEG